jgi:hypothetical protein
MKHTKNKMKTEKPKKRQRKNEKLQNMCFFLHMTRFLPENGGLNGWAIIDVLLKSIERKRYKNRHSGKHEKQEMYQKVVEKCCFAKQ